MSGCVLYGVERSGACYFYLQVHITFPKADQCKRVHPIKNDVGRITRVYRYNSNYNDTTRHCDICLLCT